MKVLTLHQPWATMCMVRRHAEDESPIKWIETRSWAAPESVIGQRIAIHAGKKKPQRAMFGEFETGLMVVDTGDRYELHDNRHGNVHQLPLGVLLGTVRLAACIPMTGSYVTGADVLVVKDDALYLDVYPDGPEGSKQTRAVGHQRPFGWFEPGRWAWIFTDQRPFARHLPKRGYQGLWNVDIGDDE